jgi:esterase/lipase superfamily enzyme
MNDLKIFPMIIFILLLTGCASVPTLMPTPNSYLGEAGYPETKVKPEQKTTLMDILYATDRSPLFGKDSIDYGSGRSPSLAFGSAVVDVGDHLSWEELVEESQTTTRKNPLDMIVVERTEIGRFPNTPHAFVIENGVPVDTPEIKAAFEATRAQFKKEINRRLALSEHKDITIYIHGFNNTFDEAVTNLAGVWHFMGRQGIPLVYSWPAAHGGLFGYFIDRESGEFTIFHLKTLLKLLASFEDIENINIIAHSRGTDVITTALRELIIESRAAGNKPRQEYRIKNLILAAPDLDLGVMSQRLIAEKFGAAIKQITIYTAQTDTALNISEFIMTGLRLGRLKSNDFSETEVKIFSTIKNVNFINVLDVRSFVSHAYYLNSPSASSDLIRVLRRGSKPGSADRPLKHKQNNFWEIPKNYPNASIAQ